MPGFRVSPPTLHPAQGSKGSALSSLHRYSKHLSMLVPATGPRMNEGDPWWTVPQNHLQDSMETQWRGESIKEELLTQRNMGGVSKTSQKTSKIWTDSYTRSLRDLERSNRVDTPRKVPGSKGDHISSQQPHQHIQFPLENKFQSKDFLVGFIFAHLFSLLLLLGMKP